MTKEEILNLLETDYLNGDIDIKEVKRRIGVYEGKSSIDTFTDLGIYEEFKKIQNKRRGLSAKKTNIKRHGVANGHDANAIEKLKQTSLKKYGTEHPWQSEIVKQKSEQTKFERYKDKHYTNREKCWETTKKNGWYKTSLEDRYLPLLQEKFPDIVRHYVSDKYPFECDFYVPSKDLYIELNIFWMHGGHIFDETNSKDIERLNKLKSTNSVQSKYAIDVWTKKDLIKYKMAIKNKLNYLILWSEQELVNFIENDNYELVDTTTQICFEEINPDNKLQCQLCGQLFENSEKMNKHICNFHKIPCKKYFSKFY